MTCKQLGGGCDKTFQAETFEEIAALSKEHGNLMFKQKDRAHLQAMAEMMVLMQNPKEMEEWMSSKRAKFESLHHD